MRHATLVLSALLLVLGLSSTAAAQTASAGTPPLVINEVDADQAGTDAAEFVELYNDGASPIDLAGYVLVFFNGSDDASYNAVDLDGFTLAAGDYFVYCGDAANVANCDLEVGAGTTNLIQNGADAVALYLGEASSFPEDTPVTTTSLVDAVVYGTNDSDDSGLLSGLNVSVQYNDTADESIQRSPDGAEAVINAAPTPGAANAVVTGPETFTALLRGENEVPAVETDAKGGATAVLDGTSLTVTGTFAGLAGDYLFAHLHGGAAGENGGVVITLDATVTADNRGGSFEAANNTFEVRPTFADSIRAGLAYVNVHSAAFTSGELRGQLGTDTHALPFALSGDNEVPPVATPATGSGTASLDGSTVTVTGSFSGLTGDYLFSHIHAGAAGANGGVVVTLAATVDADNRGGTFEAANNMFEVRPTFADSIRAGLAYVNVHSAAFNSGELRGQIGVAAETTSTLAEARAAGVGATVTVEGTVTRTMGAFTYIQDETGGLTIRQTSGAFFDAVDAGTIAPGTTLRLTGTLSEFRSLLQLNGSGLTDFEVTGTADVPAPQVVTLAQIAAAGESYEGELVTVENVTIDAAGDTDFAASKTYQISDDSDDSNGVTLRTPGSDDSSVDGTPIPAQATITAVVGQFSSSDPAVGYQLLVIDAADIAASVASEGDAAAGLSLGVANPVSRAATVRFSLDAPGLARVALYDALGRQVAVVAEGEMATGPQTVRLDAGALAAGVYVLRLETETGALAQTLTVVR